jgi:triosephosphate isomerase
LKKIIASNFKTNHTRKSTREFIDTINQYMNDESIENDVYIFPPATALDQFTVHQKLNIGTQNAYHVKNGSFTGEIGTEQLDEFGIKTILIGHSERRHILGESQKEIALKYNYFKALGYKIIYCVGEPLEVKEKGLTETLGYVFEQFDGIDLEYDNLVIAYEPVWAIGTGISATLEDIAIIHKKLKKKITAPLLYGGSVKLCGLQDILEIDNVDGVLVGTASWDKDDFKKMIYIGSKTGTLKEKIDCKN